MKYIAIYALHPIMYQTPIFSELQSRLKLDNKFRFKVLFGDDISIDESFYLKNDFITAPPPYLMEGYHYKILKNWAFNRRKGFFSRVNLEIYRELKKGGYKGVIIHGYDNFSSWYTLIISKILGLKVVWRGEAVLTGRKSKFSFKQKLKGVLLKWFFRQCNALMYSCSGNKTYLKFYGAKKSQLFFIPCAVNNYFFQKESKKYLKQKLNIKKKIGIIDEKLVVLFSARFTRRKRPMDLLNAIEKINHSNISLLFVGDGPEKSKIEDYALRKNINIIFTGFVNQTDISRYYSIADVNIIISDYDPSPKAINEAMNFKLPIIVSDVVGTSSDLVFDGKNGFIIKCGDIDSLSKKLEYFNLNREQIKIMGQKSFDIVQKWNYKENVNGIMKAFDHCFKS